MRYPLWPLILLLLAGSAFASLPSVDPQVINAVTQSNTKVVGDAPAQAMGAIYVSLSTTLPQQYHPKLMNALHQCVVAQNSSLPCQCTIKQLQISDSALKAAATMNCSAKTNAGIAQDFSD